MGEKGEGNTELKTQVFQFRAGTCRRRSPASASWRRAEVTHRRGWLAAFRKVCIARQGFLFHAFCQESLAFIYRSQTSQSCISFVTRLPFWESMKRAWSSEQSFSRSCQRRSVDHFRRGENTMFVLGGGSGASQPCWIAVLFK